MPTGVRHHAEKYNRCTEQIVNTSGQRVERNSYPIAQWLSPLIGGKLSRYAHQGAAGSPSSTSPSSPARHTYIHASLQTTAAASSFAETKSDLIHIFHISGPPADVRLQDIASRHQHLPQPLLPWP